MRHLFWGLFLLKRNKRLNNCEKWALKNTHNNATRPNLWVEKSAPAFSFFGGNCIFRSMCVRRILKTLLHFQQKIKEIYFLRTSTQKPKFIRLWHFFWNSVSQEKFKLLHVSSFFRPLWIALFSLLFCFSGLALWEKIRLPTRVNELSLWWEMRPVLSREPESFFRRLAFLWNF